MKTFTKDILNIFLFENSPVPIAWLYPNGTFFEVNDAFCTLVGYAKGEMEEKMRFQDITYPADLEGDLQMVRKQLKDNTTEGYTMTKRYITKDGRTVWVNLIVFDLREKFSRDLEMFLAYAIPLPNGGRFKVEKSEGEIHVRPTITMSQFIKDNWPYFVFVVLPIFIAFVLAIFYLYQLFVSVQGILQNIQ